MASTAQSTLTTLPTSPSFVKIRNKSLFPPRHGAIAIVEEKKPVGMKCGFCDRPRCRVACIKPGCNFFVDKPWRVRRHCPNPQHHKNINLMDMELCPTCKDQPTTLREWGTGIFKVMCEGSDGSSFLTEYVDPEPPSLNIELNLPVTAKSEIHHAVDEVDSVASALAGLKIDHKEQFSKLGQGQEVEGKKYKIEDKLLKFVDKLDKVEDKFVDKLEGVLASTTFFNVEAKIFTKSSFDLEESFEKTVKEVPLLKELAKEEEKIRSAKPKPLIEGCICMREVDYLLCGYCGRTIKGGRIVKKCDLHPLRVFGKDFKECADKNCKAQSFLFKEKNIF